MVVNLPQAQEDPPPKSTKPEAIKSSKPAKKKRYELPYTPRSRYAEHHQHFIAVLTDRDMLKLFVDITKDNTDFYEVEIKKNQVRKKWVNAFRYIYDNWEIWVLYRDKKTSPEVKAFIAELFGEEYLDYKDPEKIENFRRGRNLDINELIAMTGKYVEFDLECRDKKID